MKNIFPRPNSFDADNLRDLRNIEELSPEIAYNKAYSILKNMGFSNSKSKLTAQKFCSKHIK